MGFAPIAIEMVGEAAPIASHRPQRSLHSNGILYHALSQHDSSLLYNIRVKVLGSIVGASYNHLKSTCSAGNGMDRVAPVPFAEAPTTATNKVRHARQSPSFAASSVPAAPQPRKF